jgi:hypothetical protein
LFVVPVKWQAKYISGLQVKAMLCLGSRDVDTKFKLIVMNYTKKMNNCIAPRKLSVAEADALRLKK